MKMLVVGSGNFLNNGNLAMAKAFIDSYKDKIPGLEVVLLSEDAEGDHARLRDDSVRLITMPWRSRALKADRFRKIKVRARLFLYLFRCLIWRIFRVKGVLKSEILSEYKSASCVISLSGDSISEDYSVQACVFQLYAIFLGIILKKKAIVYAQSVGTFKSGLLKKLVPFVFNRCALITVRENISYEYLPTIGVKETLLRLTADAAFLLKPSPDDELDEVLVKENILFPGPYLGVSLSSIIERWAFVSNSSQGPRNNKQIFIEVVASILDRFMKTYRAHIIFIPHVMQPDSDDRKLALYVLNRLKNRGNAHNLQGEYSASVMKAVIARCTALVGFRMHPAIAAVSMGIPVVSVAYSHKAKGIIGRMMGQEEFVVDIRGMSPDEFRDRMNYLLGRIWTDKGRIKARLEEKLKVARKLIHNADKEIVKILNEKKHKR